jgi:hypothetical protein
VEARGAPPGTRPLRTVPSPPPPFCRGRACSARAEQEQNAAADMRLAIALAVWARSSGLAASDHPHSTRAFEWADTPLAGAAASCEDGDTGDLCAWLAPARSRAPNHRQLLDRSVAARGVRVFQRRPHSAEGKRRVPVVLSVPTGCDAQLKLQHGGSCRRLQRGSRCARSPLRLFHRRRSGD